MTTNAEKANALAKDYLLEHDRANIAYEEMLRACLDMAEWKDAQFKEYLEKKRKKYTNGLSIALQKNAKQEAVVNDKIQCLLNEIIKELFKED